jgi:hypothetical protein
MGVTVTEVLATSLLVGLLVLGAALLARGPGDVVMLFILGFGLFYAFRPVLFSLGLDVPFPEELFDSPTNGDLVAKTALGLSLFLALALAGVAVVTVSHGRGFGPFFIAREMDLRRAALVVTVLTGLSALISMYLLVKFGGVGRMISAAKYDKALAGLYVLRTMPAVGAVVATATLIDARARQGVSRQFTLLALSAALLNAFFVFLWGSRSVLVIVGATLILGLRTRGSVEGRRKPKGRAGRTRRTRNRVVVRLLLAGGLVIAVAAGLRMARDDLTHGEVQSVYAEAGVARQASLATNSILFDASMLSFRDWPEHYRYRGGEDFYNGAVGVIPRAVWSGKPTAISPGKWFRQVYEPGKVNGWPMGAGALWYLNFGWWGLVVGGLISGTALGLVAAAQRRRPSNGFNTAVGVVIGVYVLGLGWDSETLIRSIIWLVPLWAVGKFVAPKVRQPVHLDDVDEPGSEDPDAVSEGQLSPA